MAQIVTNAIVLRRADYRENDRMITLFSPSMGRIDALCRGCRRQKSPLMAASELFCAGEYVLYQTSERTTVVSCQVTDTYYALRNDYERLSHGMYMLELCGAAVQPAQENERLFLLLLRALAHLCYGDVPARRITAVFLMGMTSLLGFRPQVGRCAKCGTPVLQNRTNDETLIAAFSPEHGGVLCPGCSAGERCRLREKDVVYLQEIMRRGIKSLDAEGDCPQALFDALRSMAEGRLDTPIRSGRMLV
ncbi:MAG: DNA repair protein RecO [Clostridia bacterium]|nr:DNA repair protein RecO [Clostridia bacterium]